MADRLDPKSAGSQHIHIRRCLGNLARGNQYRCHPDCEPGGYDVGFAMMDLNVHKPFATFEEAKEFALCFEEMLGLVLKKDREGDDKERAHPIADLREVDVFCGTSAYVLAERFLKTFRGGPYAIIGDLRKCRFGWLARWDTRAAWNRWAGERGWYAWEGESHPEGQKKMLLVIPPSGMTSVLDPAPTLEERLQSFSKENPDIAPVYDISPEYDTLVNAGVDGWRAEAVLGLSYTAQIEIVWRSYKSGDFDSKYADEARTIIERCAGEAGVNLSLV